MVLRIKPLNKKQILEGEQKMKKLIALTIAVLMIFTLVACGGGGSGGTTSGPAQEADPTPEPATPTPPPQEIEGEFFPGIKDEDIPEILMRKVGIVEHAEKVESSDPAFSYEIFITLAEVPINFFSILSFHYQDASESYDVPLDESLVRTYSYDWGYIELSPKDLLIEEGRLKIHAVMY